MAGPRLRTVALVFASAQAVRNYQNYQVQPVEPLAPSVASLPAVDVEAGLQATGHFGQKAQPISPRSCSIR